MNEWKTAPAEKFCLSVRDGTHDSPKPVEVGRKLITSRHMISGRLDLDSAYLISATDFEKINHRSKVDQWDVLISMIGTVGDVYLEQNDPDYAIKNIGLFKSRSPRHGRWLYYYLKSPEARAELRSRCRGTTQLYIPLGELRAFPIRFPRDEAEQEHIVEILGSLDDKIELNRRMNETLEAMAQAIFRDWFVDFGPTQRKLDGGTDAIEIMGGLVSDPGRARELADLFPARLGDDGLPEGWGRKALSTFIEIQNGYAFKSADWREHGVPVIKIGSVKPGLVDIENVSFVSDEIASAQSRFRVPVGAAVIGLTGYVGEVGRVPPTYVEPLLNQRVGRILGTDGKKFMPFAYTVCRTSSFKEYAISKAHGSAQPNVSTKDLKQFPVCFGTHDAVAIFDKLTEPIYERQLAAIGENQALSATRDLLLPKLMSGEIRLQDAHDKLEAAQ